MKEYIVSPAVDLRYEGNRKGSLVNTTVMCIHYQDDRVDDGISNLVEWGVNHTVHNGFITNKGRFVEPSEAFRIVLDSRQLPNHVIEKCILECDITLKIEHLYEVSECN